MASLKERAPGMRSSWLQPRRCGQRATCRWLSSHLVRPTLTNFKRDSELKGVSLVLPRDRFFCLGLKSLAFPFLVTNFARLLVTELCRSTRALACWNANLCLGLLFPGRQPRPVRQLHHQAEARGADPLSDSPSSFNRFTSNALFNCETEISAITLSLSRSRSSR